MGTVKGTVKDIGRVARSVDSLVKEDVKPLIGNEIKETLEKANKLLDKDIPSLIRCIKIGIFIIAVSVAIVSVGACVKFFI